MSRLRLAYVAHNAHDWAEFIVNVPTVVVPGVSVYHYSESRPLVVRNSMIAVSEA